jgi:hypothetical protein
MAMRAEDGIGTYNTFGVSLRFIGNLFVFRLCFDCSIYFSPFLLSYSNFLPLRNLLLYFFPLCFAQSELDIALNNWVRSKV